MSLRSISNNRLPKRDRIIQSTDFDALSSKYSSYLSGYITKEQDPFVEILVTQFIAQQGKLASNIFVPKLPLINRGTYIRVHSIDLLVDAFLKSNSNPKQIISLGAGSDSRPFQLFINNPSLIYHEIDFPSSTSRKVSAILKDPRITNVIADNEDDLTTTNDEIHTSKYHLHALDLRSIKDDNFNLLKGMNENLETLIISECCLCYLEPTESSSIISWFLSKFQSLACIIYEPIGLDDQFGKVMIQNLAMRGISLPTLNKYPNLQSQVDRLTNLGFSSLSTWAADMEYIHDNWISEENKDRIDKLEFLDEREELNLLLRHYCVAWGSTYSLRWEFPSNHR